MLSHNQQALPRSLTLLPSEVTGKVQFSDSFGAILGRGFFFGIYISIALHLCTYKDGPRVVGATRLI